MILKVFTQDVRVPLLGGLFLCGILAAIMSTADSQLLVSASAVSEDLYVGVMRKEADDDKILRISRITVLVIAIIAYIIAWNPNSSVFNIVSFAWAGFGASFGPVVLLALFWKRSNLWGALAGMMSGGAMIFIWKFLVRPMGGALDIYELLPAFLIALIVNVIVSLLTPAPSKEIEQEFESVR